MTAFRKTALGFFVFLSLSFPLFAAAAIIPFGGRVTSWLPCLNGGIHVSVVNLAGVGSGAYVWTPATFTYLYGPPAVVGQHVLGTADIPYACVLSFVPFIAIPGLRMFMLGTSGVGFGGGGGGGGGF